MTPAIMVQGTGSDVGKSLLCAGLCRAFTQSGLRVRPFKPQNMSNNAAATADGGEIGRAQALQALACGIPANVHMNPVLLKPQGDRTSQLIVQGKHVGQADAAGYIASRGDLLVAVMQSYHRLCEDGDLIIVEGAGSPAEVNLRAGDIANMGFARAANVPVILLGDIHRGGVIAALAGTQAVLDSQDAAHIKAFIVNRFRGDPDLFEAGVRRIEQHTTWPCLGVLPELDAARVLPAEDAVMLERPRAAGGGSLHIVVPVLPCITNFDDLDPLRLHDGVRLTMLRAGQAVPGDADVVLIPGSKATIADLAYMRTQGWPIDIAAHVRRGGKVLGICGGYQMLGTMIHDPDGIEGPAGSAAGLGLLNIETILHAEKRVASVDAVHTESRMEMRSYEIHIGVTTGADCVRPFAHVAGRADGARSADGRIEGTYLHGLFCSDAFRSGYLGALDASLGEGESYSAQVEAALDAVADAMRAHLDLARILATARAGLS